MTGQAARCSYKDPTYDRAATIKLLRLFLQHPMVTKVFFNDDEMTKALARVGYMTGHDDHIHVKIREFVCMPEL